jgi:hypothetical protein
MLQWCLVTAMFKLSPIKRSKISEFGLGVYLLMLWALFSTASRHPEAHASHIVYTPQQR